MEKKPYYVTLHTGFATGEIRDVKNDASFDFAIEATPEEAARLRELFEQAANQDFDTFKDGHIPFPTDIGHVNTEKYDQTVTEIYRMIHELGSVKTKSDIEKMAVLNNHR